MLKFLEIFFFQITSHQRELLINIPNLNLPGALDQNDTWGIIYGGERYSNIVKYIIIMISNIL